MKTSLIEDPLKLDSKVLLQMIEEDPEAFMSGRRNDDLVNWFLAKRMVEVQVPGGADRRPLNVYVEDFEKLKAEFTRTQIISLQNWNFDDMNAEFKISQLYQYYGHHTTLGQLEPYWIPMIYRRPDTGTDPML